MQIPLVQVTDAVTASGGLLQNQLGSGANPAAFEADLKAALGGSESPATTVIGKILKKLGGASTGDAADGDPAQASAAGVSLLQTLSILSQAGLSEAEIVRAHV